MNGRLIVDLPTSLSASIVSEWLNVKDRVRLDSAHCQASVRDEFLQLNRSPELSVKSWVLDVKSQVNRALVTWAWLREVYVEKLSIDRDSDVDVYTLYLHRFASRVFDLRLHCSNITLLAQSIATCCNLLVLKVHNLKLTAPLRDVFIWCQRLREFSFHYSFGLFHPCDPESLDPPLTCAHLATLVCNNLKYLELEKCAVNLVAAFLRMAVAVEVVVLTTEDAPLNSIPESLSLTANTLSLMEMPIDESLANFAPRGELLENLCFPWSNVTDTAIRALCLFPNLKALDLTCAKFETEDYLSVLVRTCGENLTELLLYLCYPTLPLVTVQEVLPLLTQLKSFSFCFEDSNTAVWDMASFRRLTQLAVYYKGTNSSELVSQLTEHCHANIRELSLRMIESDLLCDNIDMLVSRCTNLRILNVKSISTDHLWCTEEDKERWKSLRSGLTVGEHYEYGLNVFTKYECTEPW